MLGAGRFEVERFRLGKPLRLYSPGDRFWSCGRCEDRVLGGAAAARSSAGGGDFRVEAEDRVFRRLGLRVRIALHGRRKALQPLEHAAQPSEPGRSQSRLRTDRLAYASPHLPGVARRQWRAAYGAEGTHAARIHPDHAQYIWRRDDGINAGSAWESGTAGNAALMDASGRQ